MPLTPTPLERAFYDRPTEDVARGLIGCLVVHRDRGIERMGRIVETEAYLGEQDLACHSARGRTPRNEVMFGPPGHAYIYFIYGMYYCLNAVTRPEGVAEAVLLRAIEPIAECLGEGDGPGKLCRALSVDRRLNGADLCSSELFIAPPIRPVPVLARGPRVGVAYAKGWARRRLRFWERGSPFVSRAGGARSS